MPEMSDVERDLASLLSLEPSAGFAAGVRARAARVPKARLRLAWALAAAAAVILCAGAAVTWIAREGAAPARPNAPSPAARIAARPLPAVPAPAEPRPTRAAVRSRPGEVEIVIDPAFSQAVRRLWRDAQHPPAAAAPAVPVVPPADVVIAPMVVEELSIPVIKVVEPRSLSK
jgi:hypothetical protein